ncbi:discoidin domain-containing protein [Paenibacillus sp. CC-CFT747]|nr:discoidin domain-containing protein [Paenibacillus sp. CC-CFT747]
MKLYALPAGFRYQVPQQLPPEPPAIGPYTNLALHKTVTASSDYGRSGWYARAVTDGQRTSTASSMGWTSYNDIKKNHTEWITVDMGASYKINTLDLYPRADGKNTGLGYPKDFTIQVSEDNVHWSVAASGHQETRPTGMMEYTFPMTSARYVKIEGTQLTGDPFGNYHMQFAEIEIYSRTESHLTLELKPSKLLVGKTGELHVFGWTPEGEIDPLDGAVVRFSSSNPAVAGVDDKGTVTAKAEGEAVLTAEVTKRNGTVDKGEYELMVESLPSPWKADFYGKAYGLINPVEDGFRIRANGLGHGPEEDDLVYLYQDFTTENPVTVTSVIDSVYRTANGRDGSAGIMFRNGSEADASGSFVSLTVNPQGRIVMTARTEAGTVQELKGPYTVFPVELKLVKTGNRFTGFYKKEGAWIPVSGNPGHSGITVNMGKAIKAGMAVFSEESELYTAASVSQIRFESGPGRP